VTEVSRDVPAEDRCAFAADVYATERGWRVLPVHWIVQFGDRTQCSHQWMAGDPPWMPKEDGAGKHPIIHDWQTFATTDRSQIATWWGAEYPGANVGVATGRGSGIWVLDVDEGRRRDGTFKEGLDSLVRLTTQFGELPDTYAVRTGGGGIQYYFEIPDGLEIRTVPKGLGGDYRDIDIKGEGGFVVAPPSASGKGPYTVERDVPVVMPPDWLIHFLMESGTAVVAGTRNPSMPDGPAPAGVIPSDAPGWVAGSIGEKVEAVRTAPDGEGNNTINRMAYMIGQYVPHGWITFDDAHRRLMEAVGAWAQPHPQADYTIRRALQQGASDPYVPQTAPELPAEGGEVHRGQLRIAMRLAARYAGSLLYAHGIGWHVWDGTRWARDQDGAVMRAVRDALREAIMEIADMDERTGRALYDDVRKCESSSSMEGIMKIASSLEAFAVAGNRLDADPYLFNTASGTLDLRTGDMRRHNPQDLITKVTPFAIGGDGREFRAFLERILPENETRRYVQKLFGYAMYGKVTEHIMPIFTGEGANGKGTLRDAVKAAFGDYAVEVEPELLISQKHQRHGSFKMRLRGARLVFMSETERDRRFDEATMKKLTGGDPIEANYMRQNPIEFQPSHTLVMVTNHLPRLSDDPACWRRLRAIPFDVNIPLKDQDGHLPERLIADGGSVLAWILEGFRMYRAEGLALPDVVDGRTRQYRLDSDVIARFLDEVTVSGGQGQIKASDLYQSWSMWCTQGREYAGTATSFGESVKNKGIKTRRTSRGVFYVGMAYRPPGDDEDEKQPDQS
jgi:putative DNA primase/helicase